MRNRLLTTRLEALRAAKQRKDLLAERTRAAEPALPQQGEPEEERWRIARGDPYVDRALTSTLSQHVAIWPSALLSHRKTCWCLAVMLLIRLAIAWLCTLLACQSKHMQRRAACVAVRHRHSRELQCLVMLSLRCHLLS